MPDGVWLQYCCWSIVVKLPMEYGVQYCMIDYKVCNTVWMEHVVWNTACWNMSCTIPQIGVWCSILPARVYSVQYYLLEYSVQYCLLGYGVQYCLLEYGVQYCLLEYGVQYYLLEYSVQYCLLEYGVQYCLL
ncbi:hypothetical protein PoB_004203400 [Plakobranchus ocellatus]|uniref:SRCR domain-containing protein n=1 Tax=Plakobranchus ocellatus TaxID=259542 RepID=A0AAV4B606_9GAST|nr:hypothetical protein PoB_004203400 [Plakobranchus ocellatus]